MTIHSMNVYLDDTAFDRLKTIEEKLYKDKNTGVRNRSDVFTHIIYEYLKMGK